MTPYFEDEFSTIYCGDCREILPLLQPGDVVVADPPYQQTSLDWDRWQEGWPYAVRANSLWVFGTMRMFLDRTREIFAEKFQLSQDLVWQKHNGSSFHADRFRRVHEAICHFYRGPWEKIYKSVPTTPTANKKQVRRKQRPAHMGHIDAGSFTSIDGGPQLMESVIFAHSCHGYAVNETQKPLAIIRPLLEYSCPPGGLVIDPFMGSGTTLVAAKEMGFKAIGIEARESQCYEAATRLKQSVLDFTKESPCSNPL